jgi:uncharacterized protein
MNWEFKKTGKLPEMKEPIFIEGLPGIGNVGKVAIDFIIDEKKAKKIYDVQSYSMPHSVFVNENNLVELPKIEMFYKKINGKDMIFLTGDVQPIDERSCYEFCDSLLDLLEKLGIKEIITLGGIGLHKIPKAPHVYCTGNSKKLVKKYKEGTSIKNNVYGVVGPIVGVSGLLLGLAQRRKIQGVSLLAETYGHPVYLGIKGAKEILKVLDKKLKLKINLKDLDKEIKELETDLLTKSKVNTQKNMKKPGTDYIG